MAKLRRPHTAEPVGGYEGEVEFSRSPTIPPAPPSPVLAVFASLEGRLHGQPDFAEQHPSRRGEAPLLRMTLGRVVAAQKTKCRFNKPPRQCAMILMTVVRHQTCPIRKKTRIKKGDAQWLQLEPKSVICLAETPAPNAAGRSRSPNGSNPGSAARPISGTASPATTGSRRWPSIARSRTVSRWRPEFFQAAARRLSC